MPVLKINYFLLLDANDDEEKKKDKAVNTATRAAMGGGMRV